MSDHGAHDSEMDDAWAESLVVGGVPADDARWGSTVRALDLVQAVGRRPVPQVLADAHLAAVVGALAEPEVDDALAQRRGVRRARQVIVAGVVGAALLGGAAAAMEGPLAVGGDPDVPAAVAHITDRADAAVAVAMDRARAEGAAPGLAGGEPPGQAVADGDGPTTGRPVCPDDERGVGVGDENRATEQETGPCEAPGIVAPPGEPSTTAPGRPDDAGHPDDDQLDDADDDADDGKPDDAGDDDD